jgi:DNA-binding transcriptional regulator YiaG
MTPTEFRAALASLNLSQRKFALRLGLSPLTVNRWAQSKAPVPSYAIAYLELLQQISYLVESSTRRD